MVVMTLFTNDDDFNTYYVRVVLLQVMGATFVVVALLLYIDTDSPVYSDLITSVPSAGPMIVLDKLPTAFFVIGLLVLLLSFLGCYGACAESVCFLWLVMGDIGIINIVAHKSEFASNQK